MNINEDLLNFILKYLRIKDRDKLSPLTRLEEDLYLYGEDAEEFLWNYSDRFLVDISNFEFSKYFTNEGFFYCYAISKWLCRNKKTKTLTIGDLERGIQAGHLDNNVLSKKTE